MQTFGVYKSEMISLKFSGVCFYDVSIFDFLTSGSVDFQRCLLEHCLLINEVTLLTRIKMTISNTRIRYVDAMSDGDTETLISVTIVDSFSDVFNGNFWHSCGSMIIKNSSFNNSSFMSWCHNYTPKVTTNRTLSIHNCEFRSASLVVRNSFKVTILDSRFTQSVNTTNFIVVILVKRVELHGCAVLNNKGTSGTVRFENVVNDVDIRNCTFQNNSAFEGGAIYSKNSKLVIRDSTFIENTATISGGAIFSSGGSTTLSNVYVSGPAYGPVTGRHLYFTRTETLLENVTLNVNNKTDISPVMMLYNIHDTLIYDITLSKLHLNCPIGHTAHTWIPYYGYLILFCKACGLGKYNLTRGKIFIKTQKIPKVDELACSSCELGGVCNSHIKSAGNYWGYVSDRNHVIFTPCLENYCCSPHTTPCTSYDTCAERRTGKLCGVCEEGFSLNFFSASCISNDHCTGLSRSMYHIGHIVLSLMYALFLLYLKDIITYLKRKLISNDEKPPERRTLRVSMLPSTSQVPMEPDDENGVLGPAAVAPIPAEDTFSKNMISGLIKIAFFFYQVESLLRVHTSLKGNYRYNSWLIQGLLSFVFNIKMNIDSKSLIFCPFKDLDSIGKIALKASFIPSLFVVLLSLYWGYCFIYTVRKYVRKTRKDQNEGNKYHVLDDAEEMESPILIRVKRCAVKLTLLGYIAISTFAFKCINCVPLGGGSSHLYVQGIRINFSISLLDRFVISGFFSKSLSKNSHFFVTLLEE